MTKLIVLDRDGVINEDSDEFIKSPDEFIPIPGSLKAISLLKQAGYTVVVSTNQSGIARGLFTEKTLELMHEKLATLLAKEGGKVDGIYYCPHGPDDHCDCRKPKPGMLLTIFDDFNVKPKDVPKNVIVIGDSMRDLEAAVQVGALPILVTTGKGQKTKAMLPNHPGLQKTTVFINLLDSVNHLLTNR